MDERDTVIIDLQDEVLELHHKIDALQTQLSKYTNNERHKKYYEQNKEKVKEKAKQYLNRLKIENPEKLKEYRHRAYVKRKGNQV
jgi:ABC-type dipeptide/oligopeptide/nickel transport system ATPase component